MTARSDTEILREVQDRLRSAGLPLFVDVQDGVVRLQGTVVSEAERQAACDLSALTPGVQSVEDDLELTEYEIDIDSLDSLFPTEYDEDDGVTDDPMLAASEGLTYFPPTDPPTRPSDNAAGYEIASGFSSTALDDNLEEDDEEMPGDEELVERVLRDLRQDSATSHLKLFASAYRGVVVLTGVVHDPGEAEAAVEVASQTIGVQDVVDRIVVTDQPNVPYEQRPWHRQSQMQHVVTPSASWRATVIANRFRLEDMRQQGEERLKHLEADLAAYGVDQDQEGGFSSHDADVASDVAAASEILAEINALKNELRDIDDALKRMHEGRYGICIDTGQLIDAARLKANPLAIRTVEAQRRYEASLPGRS